MAAAGGPVHSVETAVIGAGVVGLAIAAALAESGREVVLLERNDRVGAETTSRNSEVVHAGLYYTPGGLKSRLCVEGRERLYAWCAARGVPHARLGKLIVATAAEEEPALAAIAARADAAGVALEALDGAAARRREPALRAVAALHSPRTGIVDSHQLCLSLLGAAEDAGAALALNARVLGGAPAADGVRLRVAERSGAVATLAARLVVNAAGLHAQALAAAIDGAPPPPPAVYFKGSYFALTGMRAPFSRLIYPAPPLGGLGIHLTLDLSGAARFGPDVEPLAPMAADAIDYSVDPGRSGAFEDAIRRYWPGLPGGALAPDYAGVRPKIHADYAADFRIDPPVALGGGALINLFGIESPGLTACLAIAAHVRALADAAL